VRTGKGVGSVRGSKAGLAATAAAASATRGRGGDYTSSRDKGAEGLDMFVDQKKSQRVRFYTL